MPDKAAIAVRTQGPDKTMRRFGRKEIERYFGGNCRKKTGYSCRSAAEAAAQEIQADDALMNILNAATSK